MVFLQYGEVDVIDGAFVLVDKNGIRTQIPVGGLACILLETGTRITHEAVKLAANVGCLLLWAMLACGFTQRASRAARGPTGCSTRPNWRLMTRPG